MKQLNQSIKPSEHVIYEYYHYPEKVIQFGEGNFLRGFVDWMIHEMNKQGLFQGKVVAIQPTPHGKVVPKINAQDGLYTLCLRGIEDGQMVKSNEIISSISRGINPYTDWNDVLKVAESRDIQFMFSNTTEAGLTYLKEDYCELTSPLSFPGKVAAFMYHRFKVMNGAADAGLVIIPCELIENNADVLKELVLKIAKDWEFPKEFSQWIIEHNTFCNTLVDRIVTGYPTENIEEYRKLLGYDDELLTTGEPYYLFAIEADEEVANQLPFHEAGLNVKWGDVTPYRELKVRLLNGAHTMMFASCYLAGADTVFEAMEDADLFAFTRQGLFNEIFPTVASDEAEKSSFVNSVIERFKNPYNRHLLTDVGMNAIYKFKTRLIPTLLDYVNVKKELPHSIVFSLAALITYYRPVRQEGAFLIGSRDHDEYTIRDDEKSLEHFVNVWKQFEEGREDVQSLVTKVLQQTELWGLDLNTIEDLNEEVVAHIDSILNIGIKKSMQQLF